MAEAGRPFPHGPCEGGVAPKSRAFAYSFIVIEFGFWTRVMLNTFIHLDNLPAEIRKLFLQEQMETLVHTLNGDNKYATDLHLQSRGSDKGQGEQSEK